VSNTGDKSTQSLDWSVSSSNTQVSVSPTSGTLAPGESNTVTIKPFIQPGGATYQPFDMTLSFISPSPSYLGLPPIHVECAGVLSVKPTGVINVHCGSVPVAFPTVTVQNTGTLGPLDWHVSSSNPQVSVSPAGGTLAAGESVTVTATQTSAGVGGTGLHFTSNVGTPSVTLGTASVTFVCY
jgi:hypothetical protein